MGNTAQTGNAVSAWNVSRYGHSHRAVPYRLVPLKKGSACDTA